MKINSNFLTLKVIIITVITVFAGTMQAVAQTRTVDELDPKETPTFVAAEEERIIKNDYITKWVEVAKDPPTIGNSVMYEYDYNIYIGDPAALMSQNSLNVAGRIELRDRLTFNKLYSEIEWGSSTEWGKLFFNSNNPEFEHPMLMTLDGLNGYVGIGTTDPASKLHVYGTSRPRIKLGDGSAELEISIAKNANDFAPTSQPGDAVFKTHTSYTQHGLIFCMNNDGNDGLSYIKFNDFANPNTLIIRNNGNIGVGTPEPEYNLHVKGSTYTNHFTLWDDTNQPLDGYVLKSDAQGKATWIDPGELSLWQLNSNGTDISYLNGNVGIGTTVSNNYKLSVAGKILAEELEIVLSVPTSDYVFYDDYNLKPLNEVEAFIKEHKHLPEVPSAEEFIKNGYGVGEMDDLLLRKVEELTLYTIEQQKQLDNSYEVIDALILRIDELTKKLEKIANQD